MGALDREQLTEQDLLGRFHRHLLPMDAAAPGAGLRTFLTQRSGAAAATCHYPDARRSGAHNAPAREFVAQFPRPGGRPPALGFREPVPGIRAAATVPTWVLFRLMGSGPTCVIWPGAPAGRRRGALGPSPTAATDLSPGRSQRARRYMPPRSERRLPAGWQLERQAPLRAGRAARSAPIRR